MVVRDEPDGLRRYAHIGTGNYNPKTARLYEDMGLLTANPIITDDIGRLFNHLSGMSQETQYRRLLVAPHGIRTGLLDRINNEIANHGGRPAGRHQDQGQLARRRGGHPTRSTAPRRPACRSTCGCAGICTIRPGVPGLSENIRVRSILGRFLEHSRLFWFANDGAAVGRHRLGRPDAPQPGPPGRGARLDHQPARTWPRSSDLFDAGLRPRHRLVVAGPDGTWTQRTSRRARASR